MLDVIGGGAPPTMGQIVLKYVYSATGTDLSAAAEVDTVGPTDDTLYYDFSTGTASFNLTDPGNRIDWDIRFFHYDADLNSGVFGIGQGVGHSRCMIPGPVILPTRRTLMTTQALKRLGQRAVQDEIASVFRNPDRGTNTICRLIIYSRKDIYALKVGGKTYKVFRSSVL
ncbi:MAG: HmuY family protein [bacterium]|nr:HmuY family protein [bacterium]